MKIFFTADTHFGHVNILKHEPRRKELFGTTECMDKALIERWNSVVGANDVVYHLGDFAMKLSVTERILPSLNGQKYLVSGNHDKVFVDSHKKTQLIDRLIKAGFDDVLEHSTELPLSFRGSFISAIFCHYPFLEDEAEVAAQIGYQLRYENIRPKKQGGILFHGHVHSRWKFRPRCINVGADVWDYTPVLLEEALAQYYDWLENK
jgi:calcineurin-like phosphoesterase family protein